MLATLDDVAAQPITADELDRVRTKAQKDFDDTVNDPEKIGRRARRMRSRRRLAAVLHPPRPLAHADARRCHARRRANG